MALKAKLKPCLVDNFTILPFLNDFIKSHRGEYFPVFIPMKYDERWYSPISEHEENIAQCFHINELIIKEFKDEEV